MRDDGVQPLAHVLDEGGPDALAATLEADGSGAIYPVVYTRIGGKVVEHAIEPDPLMRFDTLDARRMIEELVGRVLTARGRELERSLGSEGSARRDVVVVVEHVVRVTRRLTSTSRSQFWPYAPRTASAP